MEARLAERQLANETAYAEMPFSEKSVVQRMQGGTKTCNSGRKT
jgi:hypothetical protein